MGNRSETSPSRHLTPSKAAHSSDKLIQEIEMIRYHEQNKVIAGLRVGTPTTGSTQGSGAAGATDWNVNIEAGIVVVGGVAKDFAAQADYNVHTGSVYPGLTAASKSAIAAIVCKNVSGTVTMVVVEGTVATTGSQVAPTDAEIQAAVGAGNAWVKIAEVTINRTADTAVTQSEDPTKRPLLGVNQDSGFGDWSALTE